jgi:hypothetical protein
MRKPSRRSQEASRRFPIGGERSKDSGRPQAAPQGVAVDLEECR